VREENMSRKDAGQYKDKYPLGSEPDVALAQILRKKMTPEGLPCAVAFEIAAEELVSPLDVGRTSDLLEVPIIKCQLGLFGYKPQKRIVKPAEQVSDELREAISQGLENGRLPCRTAWAIAERLHLPKMAVSSACELLKTKIGPCQLGSF
jgi:hypothetical protein